MNRATAGFRARTAFDEVSMVRCVVERPLQSCRGGKYVKARARSTMRAHQAFAKKFNVESRRVRELAGKRWRCSPSWASVQKSRDSIAERCAAEMWQNIFAEIIEAWAAPSFIALARGGDGFIQRLTGDDSAQTCGACAVGSDPMATPLLRKVSSVRPRA